MRKGGNPYIQPSSKCCGVVEEAANRALQKRAARTKPQPWIVRKLMVGLTSAVMAYSFYVFVGRLCVDMIRRTPFAGASRGAGVALLVVFSILWVWMVWAYVKAVVTPPGFAKDYVQKSDRPMFPEPQAFTSYDDSVENSRYPLRQSHSTRPSRDTDHDQDSIGGPSYENLPMRQHFKPSALTKEINTQSEKHSSVNDSNGNGNGIGNHPISIPRQPDLAHTNSKSNPKPREWDYLHRKPPSTPVLRPEHRYCPIDEIVKPYRTHHCRACGTCILKYDHHCPWIGQCVGARNQKFFLNFVQAASVFTTYTFVTLMVFVARRSSNHVDPQEIVIIALAGVFALFTIGMQITHLRLIWRGETTVESMQSHHMKDREKRAMDEVIGFWAFGAKRRKLRSYDEEWGRIGREGNVWWLGNGKKGWTDVMGGNVWGWFLPIGRSLNDGLTYPVNPRFDSQGIWQKRAEWPEELR